jgi:hypothetical protein
LRAAKQYGSPVRFELPAPLLAALRARQATLTDQPDEQVRRYGEAFLLYPGLGPEIYLLADGRVILDERAFFGTEVHEASVDEAVAAIVVGAEQTGIAGLLELIPSAPSDAVRCRRCAGSRWWRIGLDEIAKVICPGCLGRGWTARAPS